MASIEDIRSRYGTPEGIVCFANFDVALTRCGKARHAARVSARYQETTCPACRVDMGLAPLCSGGEHER